MFAFLQLLLASVTWSCKNTCWWSLGHYIIKYGVFRHDFLRSIFILALMGMHRGRDVWLQKKTCVTYTIHSVGLCHMQKVPSGPVRLLVWPLTHAWHCRLQMWPTNSHIGGCGCTTHSYCHFSPTQETTQVVDFVFYSKRSMQLKFYIW